MDPLYTKVKDDLEQKIVSGSYRTGEFIPSEQELESYYKVSRTTVRKAITLLVNEGYLSIARGRGTRVAPSKLKSKGSELMSFTELMKRQGMVQANLISKEEVPLTVDEAYSLIVRILDGKALTATQPESAPAASGRPLIEVQDLCFTYENGKSALDHGGNRLRYQRRVCRYCGYSPFVGRSCGGEKRVRLPLPGAGPADTTQADGKMLILKIGQENRALTPGFLFNCNIYKKTCVFLSIMI